MGLHAQNRHAGRCRRVRFEHVAVVAVLQRAQSHQVSRPDQQSQRLGVHVRFQRCTLCRQQHIERQRAGCIDLGNSVRFVIGEQPARGRDPVARRAQELTVNLAGHVSDQSRLQHRVQRHNRLPSQFIRIAGDCLDGLHGLGQQNGLIEFRIVFRNLLILPNPGQRLGVRGRGLGNANRRTVRVEYGGAGCQEYRCLFKRPSENGRNLLGCKFRRGSG